MISCADRVEVRTRTLDSFAASDWEDDVFVQLDDERARRREARQTANSACVLRRALDDGADFVLFLEDDLEVNRHLRHNLERWTPLCRSGRGHFFGSLYNPNIRRLESHEELCFFVADPEAVYGSQAFVLSHTTVDFVLRGWDRAEGMQDIRMSRLASRLGPIHYHLPSLAQHIGRESSWGGPFHATPEFDPLWKA
jgi:hypothetical protein